MQKAFVVIFIAMLSLVGCGSSSAPSKAETDAAWMQANANRADVVFISKISAMTEILSQDSVEPSVILQKLRKYIAENNKSYSNALAQLNDTLLGLQGEDREAFKKEASPRLDASLEAFGKAQMRLRARMNESEKVELSEVLMTLR